MRTIRITGKGELKLHPDTTRITITLSKLCKEYADALKTSTADTETLKDLFVRFSFDRKDLKTLTFRVDAEYESYREKDEYKQRLAGYRYRHTVKIDFPSDNALLGKLLYALAKSELDPEFNVSYTVRDKEAAKNELLSKAVSDAKEKAKELTAAAGVSLLEIQSIDYSRNEIAMEVRPMRMLAAKNAACEEDCSMDIEPDDIEVSDVVTVVWEIG